jgi:hypothetical protein
MRVSPWGRAIGSKNAAKLLASNRPSLDQVPLTIPAGEKPNQFFTNQPTPRGPQLGEKPLEFFTTPSP